MDFLYNNKLNVSRPIRSLNGKLAEWFVAEVHYFTAACFEKAQGHPTRNNEHNEDLFNRMGTFMGKMHNITRSYILNDPETKRADWSVETQKVSSLELPTSENEMKHRYIALTDYISELPISADPFGLIHADFHYGNFCLFDFDACRYSWFIDDIAIALIYASPQQNSSFTVTIRFLAFRY